MAKKLSSFSHTWFLAKSCYQVWYITWATPDNYISKRTQFKQFSCSENHEHQVQNFENPYFISCYLVFSPRFTQTLIFFQLNINLVILNFASLFMHNHFDLIIAQFATINERIFGKMPKNILEELPKVIMNVWYHL